MLGVHIGSALLSKLFSQKVADVSNTVCLGLFRSPTVSIGLWKGCIIKHTDEHVKSALQPRAVLTNNVLLLMRLLRGLQRCIEHNDIRIIQAIVGLPPNIDSMAYMPP